VGHLARMQTQPIYIVDKVTILLLLESSDPKE